MKLTAIYKDTLSVWVAREATDELIKAPCRRVTVELTAEQAAQIRARVTGRSGGKDIYEDLSCLFLEDDA